MDLRQLKSFLHVAELGSLSRASERLNLTQPALSRQIRLLEESLGVRLLVRTGRGVVLSEAGHRFEARVRPLVAELEQAAGDVAAETGEISGTVALAVPPSVGAASLAELVEDYRAAHPRVRVRVVVALSGAVREGILKGRLDLGIVYHPTNSAALVTEDLWTEDLVLIGRKGCGLSPDRPVPAARALAEPLVLPGPLHGLRSVVEGYAVERGRKLNVTVEAESLRLQIELVRRGAGFTLLPRRTVEAELKEGALTHAPVTDPAMRRTAALARARDRHLEPPAKAMAERILAAFRQEPSE